jgi:hypothetical protein
MGRKATPQNNLLIKFPKVANEWHPVKNGNKRPEDFLPKSGVVAWWQCEINKDHEWEARICARTGPRVRQKGKCPFCSGKKVSKDNNLQFLFPKIM